MTTLLALLTLVTSAVAQTATANFTGTGTISVWNSSDWTTATPASSLGCLSPKGKFIAPSSDAACGVFTRLDNYPYTLSTKEGNCTFSDETQERNTESIYGGTDHAWNCLEPYEANIYDDLYTIDGFPYVFLCSGDVDCYFDARLVPAPGSSDATSIWPFRWGSQQWGITPGHTMIQLVWNKMAAVQKRGDAVEPAGSRLSLEHGQAPALRGPKVLG
ncbi:uncharacterized protein CC84DRAFT_1153848 [Paraphaeosphaeria sporulosa]|uniref:Uncharacterized protein n=1 Tax=Paraphaeosphaeria sporulosa TaxID=1460663 RepID=A0A177C505_9PLEO|nr:uncharacterized protein CC84DRAFT_1153848 [Paraphaeosphaeria sporulosa]OAG01760.1 hypothetical protein CC84DRAFT_1153848 [Paraphaeosphaeria sporulosa]